MWIVDTILDRR